MGWNELQATAIINKWKDQEGALIPALHDLQAAFGYIDAQVIPLLVSILRYPRAEVQGVLSFYHDFRRKPQKSKVLQLCCAEACQAMGSRDLVRHIEQSYQTTLDSESDVHDLTVQKTYCLGNCACAPSVMYQGEVVGKVDTASLDALIQES